MDQNTDVVFATVGVCLCIFAELVAVFVFVARLGRTAAEVVGPPRWARDTSQRYVAVVLSVEAVKLGVAAVVVSVEMVAVAGAARCLAEAALVATPVAAVGLRVLAAAVLPSGVAGRWMMKPNFVVGSNDCYFVYIFE